MTAAAILVGLALGVLCWPAPSGLDRLGLTARPGRATRPAAGWWWVAGAAGWLYGGPALAVLLAAAAAAVPRWRQAREGVASRERERQRALEALGLLAAELRTGRPPALALAGAAEVAVGGSREALAAAAAAARLGGDVPAALTGTTTAVPTVWRGLATCWTVCTGVGHGLAAGVERLEEGLRAAEEQRRSVEAELAGPRATAALLAGLPLAGIALAAGLGADPLHVLLRTPVGLVCLVVGLGADLLGWLWTRALVARALAG